MEVLFCFSINLDLQLKDPPELFFWRWFSMSVMRMPHTSYIFASGKNLSFYIAEEKS